MPEPVAIWIRARGRFALSDSSRLAMAVAWAGHSLAASGSSSGSSLSPARSEPRPSVWSSCQRARVSGRWKANTRREAGSGSSPEVKRVSAPVDS